MNITYLLPSAKMWCKTPADQWALKQDHIQGREKAQNENNVKILDWPSHSPAGNQIKNF